MMCELTTGEWFYFLAVSFFLGIVSKEWIISTAAGTRDLIAELAKASRRKRRKKLGYVGKRKNPARK